VDKDVLTSQPRVGGRDLSGVVLRVIELVRSGAFCPVIRFHIVEQPGSRGVSGVVLFSCLTGAGRGHSSVAQARTARVGYQSNRLYSEPDEDVDNSIDYRGPSPRNRVMASEQGHRRGDRQ
jgi:hypothetical protein